MRKYWVQVCLTLVCVAFAGRASAVQLNLVGDAEDSDYFGFAFAAGDFDCDGDDDLVVGAPGEDDWHGAVNVVYSGSGGLTTSGNRLLKYRSFAEATGEERFGSAVAVGDFDADGCDDVAIGAYFADVAPDGFGGAVVVAYGTPGGIDPSVSEVWTQDSTGIADVAERGDAFGEALAAADFDGDGFDDLAIGAPSEDVGSISNAGAVNVLYGSASGVTASGDQFFHLDSTGVKGSAGAFEVFASRLATGDFNDDGFADLAVGTYGDEVDGVIGAGSVLILPGSSAGLNVDADVLLTQKALGFVTERVQFSLGLAAGDFDGDEKDDLAIGAPVEFGGAVHVVYGTASGLLTSGAQYWTQDTPGVPNASSKLDGFGYTLAAGNFDGDARDDLAITAPEEVINGIERAGAVTVLYGSSSGLSAQGSDFLHQNQTSDEQAEEFDKFGMQLSCGDLDGNGVDDLIVGVPLETLLTDDEGFDGAVHVYYGNADGPVVSTSQFLRQ